MRRLFLAVSIIILIVLAACGSSEDTTTVDDTNTNSEQKEEEAKGVVDPKDFDKMYSDPLAYKGYEVEFTGQVFIEPERDSDGTYLQVYAKPEDYEQNILVGIQDPDLDVATDDYVSIKGVVHDQYEGENLMGGTIAAPVIEASTVEVVDYITAVSPTIKSMEVNEELDQHGFIVQLQKIEIADNQTRVYVKVSNNTDDPISYFANSTNLVTGNKQLESEFNYESDLPEVQSDILPGVESEGVITFPAIDENTESLSFHSEGYSDNYNLDIEPFVFEVSVE